MGLIGPLYIEVSRAFWERMEGEEIVRAAKARMRKLEVQLVMVKEGRSVARGATANSNSDIGEVVESSPSVGPTRNSRSDTVYNSSEKLPITV